ncbi:MAG: hypothetical protein DMG57_08825 [Acidobacteria bacterium]|nr:MAG: hypothetical protein DMG57_08825 [Acidobacteriota bacterium]
MPSHARKFRLLAIELAGVEVDGRDRIRRVQVDMVEVSRRILLPERRNGCRDGDQRSPSDFVR